MTVFPMSSFWNHSLPRDLPIAAADRAGPPGAEPEAVFVQLADGSRRDVSRLGELELRQLQWHEERRWAELILAAEKGSPRRAQVTGQGYDTITTLLRLQQPQDGTAFAMGHSPRYERLVHRLLALQRRTGIERPMLFEIGFGSGLLLDRIHDYGYTVGGLEVSQSMFDLARGRLGDGADLHLGDLSTLGPARRGKYHVVFWNDVFEHIAPDEILDNLRIVYDILAPGGVLVTITPNWHARPSDITAHYLGPRAEAVGFHLREYKLGEVVDLLHRAGFARVATPLVVTRRRMLFGGSGLIGCKCRFETCLEWLPYRLTRMLCTRLGLNCTVAQKDGRSERQ